MTIETAGSVIPRQRMYQLISRSGGRIIHAAFEYGGINGKGNTGNIIKELVRRQLNNGFDARVVMPRIKGVNIPDEMTHIQTVKNSPLTETYPPSEDASEQLIPFAGEFWKYMEEQCADGGPEKILLHVHDAMGFVLAYRPENLQNIKTIYSIYGPWDMLLPDYCYLASTVDKNFDAMTGGLIYKGEISAFRAGVLGSHQALFWSIPHMNRIMGYEKYEKFLALEKARKVGFMALPGEMIPKFSAAPPEAASNALDILYQNMVFGDGIVFADKLLRSAPADLKVKVANFMYIGNENKDISAVQGQRVKRVGKAVQEDAPLQQRINTFTFLGRELDPDFTIGYRGTLGTFIYLIRRGVNMVGGENQFFIGINSTGKAERETPITQQEGADKGGVVLGNRTLNLIAGMSAYLLANQAAPGDFLILGASDNLYAGKITVGDHLLSEDEHGIINLSSPKRILGGGIVSGDKTLSYLAQMGGAVAHPVSGGMMIFGEKKPVDILQGLAKQWETEIIDVNSMVKLIRKDVAELFIDKEHYFRPSYKENQKELLFAYASILPDWSMLFDEAAVPSVTMDKWMKKYEDVCLGWQKDKGKPYPVDRRDWRLLWLVANDICLASLEKIALTKYLGRSVNITKEIRDKSIAILKEFGGFTEDEEKDKPPLWYFSRCENLALKDNWRELLLAVRAIKDQDANETVAKEEWMRRCPDPGDYKNWMNIWNACDLLDKSDNGIGIGRIAGLWVDTGTKRALFNAWLLLADSDEDVKRLMRALCNVQDHATETTVVGREHLRFISEQEHALVHIGGTTSFSCDNPNSKIVIGTNVVIRNSTINWRGEGDLYIPPNTVIYESNIDLSKQPVAESGATLIYRFNGGQDQKINVQLPGGPVEVPFGFYSGVMIGTLVIKQADKTISEHTIFPLDANPKEKLDFAQLADNVQNSHVQNVFQQYYADGKPLLKKELPGTSVKADDALKGWDAGLK